MEIQLQLMAAPVNTACPRQSLAKTTQASLRKGIAKTSQSRYDPAACGALTGWKTRPIPGTLPLHLRCPISDTPSATFKRVVCPREITAKTGCVRNDDATLAAQLSGNATARTSSAARMLAALGVAISAAGLALLSI